MGVKAIWPYCFGVHNPDKNQLQFMFPDNVTS